MSRYLDFTVIEVIIGIFITVFIIVATKMVISGLFGIILFFLIHTVSYVITKVQEKLNPQKSKEGKK